MKRMLAASAAGCDDGQSGPLVSNDQSATNYDHDYFIPAGTGERISAGEEIEILPAELDVRVGEVIRIINEDSESHVVGIFHVGANETMTQRFMSEGEFSGACSVHPSRQFTLRISR